MRYATVCSGIEAPTVAWEPLGFEPVWFSEIDDFPSAVLAHHYRRVPNLGNMCGIRKDVRDTHGPVDLLIGGTPCQPFSVAGLRAGLDDPRGNLALEFLRLASHLQPRWLVWENVPGVLSSNGGRDFGAFLGALGELGYWWSYRVLDAQFFGVPQRRRRVFVVGHLGDWRRALAVLAERHSLLGHTPTRSQAREIASALTASGAGGGSGPDARDAQANHLVGTLTSRYQKGTDSDVCDPLVFDTTQITHPENRSNPAPGDPAPTLPNHGHAPAIAFNIVPESGQGTDVKATEATVSTALTPTEHERKTDRGTRVVAGAMVRRLTPRECERLQGFPDDYTLIPYRGKPAADGPRYKAIGNSMATVVIRWLGRRIAMVDKL